MKSKDDWQCQPSGCVHRIWGLKLYVSCILYFLYFQLSLRTKSTNHIESRELRAVFDTIFIGKISLPIILSALPQTMLAINIISPLNER